MKKIKVLVADDHILMRDGLCQLLEKEKDIECIAQASNGKEAITLAKEMLPDVVIMDVAMPEVDGIEAAKKIKADCPGIAVLMLSAHKYRYYILACLKAGVDGYLLKDTPRQELAFAIRMVHAGKSVFDLEATNKIIHDLAISEGGKSAIHGLSSRELEILRLAARGMGNKEIGCELDISSHTVGSHLVNIFRKLGVTSRTEATLYALKEGWFTVGDLNLGGNPR